MNIFSLFIWTIVHFSSKILYLILKKIMPMTLEEKVGAVIKKIRTMNGASQYLFASNCGVDLHYLSNLENGQRNVSIEIIDRICKSSGLKLSQFFKMVEELPSSSKKPSPLPKKVVKSADSLKNLFVKYMKNQGLSKATINKYAENVPNKFEVQNIVKRISVSTHNIYNITNPEIIIKIAEDVSEERFDIVGQRMYSCGLKKYYLFLKEEILLKSAKEA